MVTKHASEGAASSAACTERSCPRFDVRKYLKELQQLLPNVPPIPEEAIKSLHQAKNYKGMVQLIKKSMNIEGVTLRVIWVPEGAVNEGPQKDAPAWIRIPEKMPPYGSDAFKEMKLDVFFRRPFLEQCTFDQVAIAVAHELSHIVLESIRHPLRGCEKAVELTAMLLGFRQLYRSASNKEWRSGVICEAYSLGYVSSEEVELADQILSQNRLRSSFAADTNPFKLRPLAGAGGGATPDMAMAPRVYRQVHPSRAAAGSGGGGTTPPRSPGGGGGTPSGGFRLSRSSSAEVRCPNPNCATTNRVGPYSFPQRPICRVCGVTLPEAAAKRFVRFLYLTPLKWTALGIGLILIGFAFLDRYMPYRGVVGNAVTGTVVGVPYRYIFSVGLLLVLVGAVGWAKNRTRV